MATLESPDHQEGKQAFLLQLSDALRPLADPRQSEATACRLLAQNFSVDRVYYLQFDAAAQVGEVVADYAAPSLPSLAGRYPLETFRSTYERISTGRTWIVEDVDAAEEIAGGERDDYKSRQLIAWIGVPLVKAGALEAMLCVAQGSPRHWASEEIEVIEETAERLWAQITRARAEAALRESELGLRMALKAGRMGTYRFDVRTGIEQWDDNEYELVGLKRTDALPTRDLFLSLVHPDDLHLVQFTSDDERPAGTSLDSEFRIIRPDNGEVRVLTAHATARFGPDGKPIELIGINQDVTEERRALSALRSTEERLQRFSEASADVLWIREARTLQWTYLSPAFDKIYGLTRQDALKADNYNNWLGFIMAEDRETAGKAIDRVASGEHVAFEYRIRRPDGEIRWLRNTDFPIRDQSGNVTHIAGVGSDITFEKTATEHQRLLLADLQHRVRNSLSVIRLIARRSTGETVEDYQANFIGRLDAFARVQTAVTRNPSAGLDLAGLIADELGAFAAKEGEAIRLTGPSVALEPRAAERLGLAIHELATNAMKYGALRYPHGRLVITWSLQPDTLDLVWQESGLTGISEPSRKGFGTEVIAKTLVYDLQAETRLEFLPAGIHCEIRLPLNGTVKGG